MHRASLHRLLLASGMMLIVGGSLLVARTAPGDTLEPPDVPSEIRVPEGNRLYLIVHAVGTQNYTCTDAGIWGSSIPQADLFDDNDRQVGTHYAGPTWEINRSMVVGSRVAGVNVSSDAIQWLLLSATPTTNGRLGQTTYIQRINTTGGLAPAGSCTSGETASVPYTADYYFYRAADPGDGNQ